MKTGGWVEWVWLQLSALFLACVGILLLIPLSLFRLWRGIYVVYPPNNKMRFVTSWRGGKWTWLWGNIEDGVTGPAWYELRVKNPRLRAYVWSALRNSASNFRWISARPGGVFFKREWRGGAYYFQAGFRPGDGWMVLAGGKKKAGQA